MPAKKATRRRSRKTVSQEVISPEVTFGDVVKDMVSAYGETKSDEGRKAFFSRFSKYLKQEASKFPVAEKYNLLFLYDNSTMAKVDSDQIYRAVTAFSDPKPILLIILSKGGDPAAAYLIGKLCQEFSGGDFVAAVPRYAKSAATVVCCAANQIHMGSLSELGPIDPQIDKMPTLGLKNSIEHIAELVKQTPESSEMFAKYLNLSIKPIQIGYYERVAESAVQYAERLLANHADSLPASPNEIATRLVYGYKDHGFVIDKVEAQTIFGTVIRTNTEEYKLANAMYGLLTKIEDLADLLSHRFYFIGGVDSQPTITERK